MTIPLAASDPGGEAAPGPLRRVAVTGATGNVGTSLVRLLAADARVGSVVGIARRPPEEPEALGGVGTEKVEWRSADDTEDDLRPLFDGADVVVHLTWAIQPSHDVETLWRVNVAGSIRVFDAVAAAGVPALVHASSVGAYAPGPKDRMVDESWPLGGVPTHPYSWQKAYVEQVLDGFEARHPGVRVVRMRPALMVKAEASRDQRRLFAGPLFPRRLAGDRMLTVLRNAPVRYQVLHTDDGADGFRRAALSDAAGAFNLADGVLGRAGERWERPLANLAELTWRLHLQPVDPGWVSLLFRTPLLDATRAHTELGWSPARSAEQALGSALGGMAADRHGPTPALTERPSLADL